jgi:hypothetical protein
MMPARHRRAVVHATLLALPSPILFLARPQLLTRWSPLPMGMNTS